jgi:hypothetical protein
MKLNEVYMRGWMGQFPKIKIDFVHATVHTAAFRVKFTRHICEQAFSPAAFPDIPKAGFSNIAAQELIVSDK